MYLAICTVVMVSAMVAIIAFGININKYEELNDKP